MSEKFIFISPFICLFIRGIQCKRSNLSENNSFAYCKKSIAVKKEVEKHCIYNVYFMCNILISACIAARNPIVNNKMSLIVRNAISPQVNCLQSAIIHTISKYIKLNPLWRNEEMVFVSNGFHQNGKTTASFYNETRNEYLWRDV